MDQAGEQEHLIRSETRRARLTLHGDFQQAAGLWIAEQEVEASGNV
jgi:hypothetical protein